MEPDEYGPFLCIYRRPDIQVEAILAHCFRKGMELLLIKFPPAPPVLRTDWAKLVCHAHARPNSGRLWWPPAQTENRRGRVRDTLEYSYGPVSAPHPPDKTVLSLQRLINTWSTASEENQDTGAEQKGNTYSVQGISGGKPNCVPPDAKRRSVPNTSRPSDGVANRAKVAKLPSAEIARAVQLANWPHASVMRCVVGNRSLMRRDYADTVR
jgi:hypothetical protein